MRDPLEEELALLRRVRDAAASVSALYLTTQATTAPVNQALERLFDALEAADSLAAPPDLRDRAMRAIMQWEREWAAHFEQLAAALEAANAATRGARETPPA